MKKTIAMFLAVVLVMSMFAGCGSKTEPAPEATTAAPAAPADAPAAPATEEETEPVKATGKLSLYSPANDEEYYLVVDAFQEKYPDIQIEVVQGGSGELKTRLESEKENPQADVMFGGLTFADAKTYGELFEEYVSTNDAKLPVAFRNTTGKVTMKSINIQTLLVNKELEAAAGVIVDGLESLLDPALKGKIAMTDPSGSATAYRWLTCLLYVMGNGDPQSEAAWNYVESLIQNLDGKLASSSSVAHKGVYEGEYLVGLTSESNATSYLSDGFGDVVGVVYPKEGTTAASYGVAMVKNCPNPDNAKLFVDFIISDECQQKYSESSIRPANTAFKSTNEFFPDVAGMTLVDEDYGVIGDHQQEFLDHFNELWAKYN